MKAALEVTPVSGTNVVELAARGPRPELLAATVNGVIEVYRAQLASAYRSAATESMAQAGEEMAKLEARVAEKRREVESFRVQHNIVSLEREENQVLARVRGLATSLNAANERTAAAEGKLRSLTESAAAGKAVVRSRDNPTLANVEQRLSQLREELRELERTFTADYLAMDPRARALRVRITELEQQLKVQREASERAALMEAQEELSSAQQTARRIQQEIAGGRQEVSQFTSRFNEYKALQEQLAQLETVHRDAVQRRARLEASERTRMPSIQTLEAATSPREPWRPLYWRDAALSVAGSLILALLAMWLVELFNRQEPQPSVLIAQPVLPGLLLPGAHEMAALPMARSPTLGAPAQALLPQYPTLPRELTQDEVGALYGAADADSRLAVLLLLNGLSPEEAVALRWSDVDLAKRVMRVGGEAGREVGFNDALATLLAARAASDETPVLASRRGGTTTLADLGTQTLCAAHDGGIERAAEVTPDCLRHTYIAFLVRQGIRFADLTDLVGPLPTEVLAAYSALSPVGDRLALDAVERVLPPLRGLQTS
jgi:integrase